MPGVVKKIKHVRAENSVENPDSFKKGGDQQNHGAIAGDRRAERGTKKKEKTKRYDDSQMKELYLEKEGSSERKVGVWEKVVFRLTGGGEVARNSHRTKQSVL